MKKNSKNLFIFATVVTFITMAIVACKKQVTQPNQNEQNTQTGILYDNGLLLEFKNYQTKIADGIKQSNLSNSTAKITSQPFKKNPVIEKLVDNYLRYQADSLVKKSKLISW